MVVEVVVNYFSPFKTFKEEFDPKKIFLGVQMTKSTKVYTCCGYVDDNNDDDEEVHQCTN